jgi:hypothetical protein
MLKKVREDAMRSVVRGIRTAAFLLALLAPMTANAQDLQVGKPIRMIVGLRPAAAPTSRRGWWRRRWRRT